MITTDAGRRDAVAWLAGRLHFEQLLADLRRRADGQTDAEPATPVARAA